MLRSDADKALLLFGDGRWLSTLRSGLPVRLHYRIEVWRSRNGWMDQLTRQVYWDVVLRHEPLLDEYTMLTIFGSRVQERRYATLDALTAALAFAYQINVSPTVQGSYYYSATLEVSTLSDDDLEELERFLDRLPARALVALQPTRQPADASVLLRPT